MLLWGLLSWASVVSFLLSFIVPSKIPCPQGIETSNHDFKIGYELITKNIPKVIGLPKIKIKFENWNWELL